MKNINIIAIVLLFLGLGGGFFAGMQYQKSQNLLGQINGQRGGNRGGQFGQRNGGSRPVVGEILSSDDKSITVKLQDGSSKIVLLSEKTQINKAATATKSDLKTGERVAVAGSDNSDGSVTASNIQLNPQTFRGVMSSPSASPR